MRRTKTTRKPEALESFKLAKALGAQGKREQAVDLYLRAIEIDPGFAEAVVNLGILYGQMGERHADDALRCLRRAVDLNPESARTHYNLGVALSRRRGQADDAIQSFEAAISIDPGHKNALYALAVQWSRKGDPVKAAGYHQWYQEAMSGGKLPAARSGSASAGPRRALQPQRPVVPVSVRPPSEEMPEPALAPEREAEPMAQPAGERRPLLRIRFVR
jgi:tetratricopeptide (TPR) repeat protein